MNFRLPKSQPEICRENKLYNNKNFQPDFFGRNDIFGDWIGAADDE